MPEFFFYSSAVSRCRLFRKYINHRSREIVDAGDRRWNSLIWKINNALQNNSRYPVLYYLIACYRGIFEKKWFIRSSTSRYEIMIRSLLTYIINNVTLTAPKRISLWASTGGEKKIWLRLSDSFCRSARLEVESAKGVQQSGRSYDDKSLARLVDGISHGPLSARLRAGDRGLAAEEAAGREPAIKIVIIYYLAFV